MNVFKNFVKPKIVKTNTKTITLTTNQLKSLIAESFGECDEESELVCNFYKRRLASVTLKVNMGESND